jgi:hypothetical protein
VPRRTVIPTLSAPASPDFRIRGDCGCDLLHHPNPANAGKAVRRLAFDRNLSPSEVPGRIRNLFRSYEVGIA